MLLSIKEMEVRKLRFAETWEANGFVFSDSAFSNRAPLVVEGTAELLPHTGGEVRVYGRIRTEIETECDRCLGRAFFPIDVPFSLFYKPAGAVGKSEEDEVETVLDAGESEMGFYELPGLELEDIVREQVELQLPMQKLCSPACKGICPMCGVNRNETECNCQPPSGDDRWMALRDLHI